MAYSIGSSMPRIYGNFKGIDLLNPSNLVDTSRSPDCLNVWKSYSTRESNIIETRPGYKVIDNFEDAINGIFVYSRTRIIIHSGTTIYRGTLDGSSQVVLYEGVEDVESQMYMFGDYLYFNDGKNYLKYDGAEFYPVAQDAYIPTTTIARNPARWWYNLRRRKLINT